MGKRRYEGWRCIFGKGEKESNFILKENHCSRIRKEKDRTKPKWIRKVVENLRKRDLEKGIFCVAKETEIKMDLFKLKRKKKGKNFNIKSAVAQN